MSVAAVGKGVDGERRRGLRTGPKAFKDNVEEHVAAIDQTKPAGHPPRVEHTPPPAALLSPSLPFASSHSAPPAPRSAAATATALNTNSHVTSSVLVASPALVSVAAHPTCSPPLPRATNAHSGYTSTLSPAPGPLLSRMHPATSSATSVSSAPPVPANHRQVSTCSPDVPASESVQPRIQSTSTSSFATNAEPGKVSSLASAHVETPASTSIGAVPMRPSLHGDARAITSARRASTMEQSKARGKEALLEWCRRAAAPHVREGCRELWACVDQR